MRFSEFQTKKDILSHVEKYGSKVIIPISKNKFLISHCVVTSKKIDNLYLYTYFELKKDHFFRQVFPQIWILEYEVCNIENMSYSLKSSTSKGEIFIKDKFEKKYLLFNKKLKDYRYYLADDIEISDDIKSKSFKCFSNVDILYLDEIDENTKFVFFLDGAIWQHVVKIQNDLLKKTNIACVFIKQQDRGKELIESEEFLTFINQTLPRRIAEQFKITPDKSTFVLVGASFGGYFAIKSACYEGEINNFICLSPSLWIDKENDFNIKNDVKLYVSFGTQESKKDMKDNCKKFCEERNIAYNVFKGSHDYAGWKKQILSFLEKI